MQQGSRAVRGKAKDHGSGIDPVDHSNARAELFFSISPKVPLYRGTSMKDLSDRNGSRRVDSSPLRHY